MHRQRTHLAARATHVAKALERRGIATTYKVHDRALANRKSRRLFAGSSPELDETQRRILAALDTDGYTVVPFSELCLDEEPRARVLAQGDAFVADTERGL